MTAIRIPIDIPSRPRVVVGGITRGRVTSSVASIPPGGEPTVDIVPTLGESRDTARRASGSNAGGGTATRVLPRSASMEVSGMVSHLTSFVLTYPLSLVNHWHRGGG